MEFMYKIHLIIVIDTSHQIILQIIEEGISNNIKKDMNKEQPTIIREFNQTIIHPIQIIIISHIFNSKKLIILMIIRKKTLFKMIFTIYIKQPIVRL
jgi:hypothetical protein